MCLLLAVIASYATLLASAYFDEDEKAKFKKDIELMRVAQIAAMRLMAGLGPSLPQLDLD